MLELKNASLARGTNLLINDATFTIYPGKHVGISGPNGAGKSSLFMLIRHELELEAGTCFLPDSLVISHVSQEIEDSGLDAMNYVLKGDAELFDIRQRLAEAEESHSNHDIAELHQKLDDIQGYASESKAAKLLSGLGFKQEQFNNIVATFSGGWQMRLNLARALMCRSDMLLLDEPTNHLDLDAVLWLEDYLKSYEGTLLLISHDRDFLDSLADQILHIAKQQATLYNGNYSDFEKQRAEKLALQQSGFEKQQKQIQHLQKFVARFKAKASKAKQAQSRVKALEKMEMISPAHIDSPFSFEFKNLDNLPHTLARIDNGVIGYGETPVLNNINMSIFAGDRLGILGANGQGKSTFIKLLAGELSLMQGEFEGNKSLSVGYFAQHQLSQLNVNASALQTMKKLDPKASDQQLLNFLGSFNFKGDKVQQKIIEFSGGEKARLVLATIVYNKPNLLLLDEPTNHLDLEMRDALSLALQSYDGALMIVAHDRYLLESVCDAFLIVSNGSVQPFDGDLEDYRKLINQPKASKLEQADDNTSSALSKKDQRKSDAEKRKKLQPLTNKLKKVEQQLEKLNSQKDEIEKTLGDTSLYEDKNKNKLKELLVNQNEISQKIEILEEEWMVISEEIEKAE